MSEIEKSTKKDDPMDVDALVKAQKRENRKEKARRAKAKASQAMPKTATGKRAGRTKFTSILMVGLGTVTNKLMGGGQTGRQWPKVFAVCMSYLSISLSQFSCFIRRPCCSRTVTSTPPSSLHLHCRTVPDPKARVKRTSTRAARSMAT